MHVKYMLKTRIRPPVTLRTSSALNRHRKAQLNGSDCAENMNIDMLFSQYRYIYLGEAIRRLINLFVELLVGSGLLKTLLKSVA